MFAANKKNHKLAKRQNYGSYHKVKAMCGLLNIVQYYEVSLILVSV